MMTWRGLDKGDRSFLIGTILAPILVWWFYYGRQKYTAKGMK